MIRSVMLGTSFLIVSATAYVLLTVGEFVATGCAPNSLTINAFLFLTGLSGLIVLLSPPASSQRYRLRF